MKGEETMQTIKAITNGDRYKNPCTCEAVVTAREIWEKSPRATARKATMDGVNQICIDEAGGRFYVYQISGYSRDAGLFCLLLDEAGRVVG